MTRTERLLNLIATLLNAVDPVPFTQLKKAFPEAYSGAEESAQRKFERDKSTLIELGVPVTFVPYSPDAEERSAGYIIDRKKFYLPEIDLTPEEMAVVFLAGTAVVGHEEFPYRRDLERALAKIVLREGEPAAPGAQTVHKSAVVGGREVAKRLNEIEQAMTARKSVGLVYRAQHSGQESERTVDPYGLFCKRGQWSLVGYCHTRKTTRVFSVHRIDKLYQTGGAFDLPSEFTLAVWIDTPPWRYDRHDPLTVTLEIDADVAWMATQQFGEAPSGDGPWRVLQVETTHADAVGDWVLGMGGRARVASPGTLRDHVASSLRAVLERYDG